MEDGPKSPWRSRNELTDPADLLRLDARSPSNLDGLGLRPIYDLYTALAQLMTPAQANELELWEIAAALGVDAGTTEQPDLDERLETEATPEQMARRIARAHIKPRRSSAEPPNSDIPEPEPKQVGEELTGKIMRQMGIRTS